MATEENPKKTSNAAGILKRLGKYLGLAAFAYVAIFGAYSFFHFSSTKSKLLQFGLSEATSQLLAIAVMLIAIALPFLSVVRIMAMRGRAFDYGMVMVLPLIAWGIQQIPAKFDATTGQALKYCAERPNGEQFCLDREGFDPQTGLPLKAVTVASVDADNRRSQGLHAKRIEVPFEEMTFFDVIDGDPIVWVYQTSDGCFEAFDNPGIHPTVGVELTPVTRELIARMRDCLAAKQELAARQQAEKLAAERKAAQEQQKREEMAAAREAEAEAQARRQAEREQALAYRQRYTSRSGRKAQYAFAVSDGLRIDPSVTSEFVRLVDDSRPDAVLRDASVRDGVFERAYQGDVTEFEKLALQDLADRVVLAKFNVDYQDNQAIRGTTNARVKLDLRVYDTSSGVVVKTLSKSEAALDYSEEDAFSKALTSLLGSVAADL